MVIYRFVENFSFILYHNVTISSIDLYKHHSKLLQIRINTMHQETYICRNGHVIYLILIDGFNLI